MKRWLTPQEVAEEYPWSKSTLEKWRAQNKGPCFHRPLGSRKIVYDRKDLDRFMASRPVATTEQPYPSASLSPVRPVRSVGRG